MTEYRIRIQNSPGWKDFDTCMVSISMGHAYHEGDKLDALLLWAIQNHKTRVLNISDILHRHNIICAGITETEASQQAYAMGNEWMRRNGDILKRRLPHFQHIHRWGEWLNHPDFEATRKGMLRYYQECPAFKNVVDADIERFSNRKEKQNEISDRDEVRARSFSYLIEELAAYVLIGRQYSANRIYPAKPLETFKYFRTAPSIPQELRGIENSLRSQAVFRKMSNPEPAVLQLAA